ncbi:hypothetical protein FWF93_00265 [Candidatus Saccharibacteria bacterium]|nr:hypothetical protein [Candidatus Saccharibacteria bacterium]
MLVTIKALVGASVKSLQSGAEIAKVAVPLIDPRNLKIMALYLESKMIKISPAILMPNDIREVGPLGIIIDDINKIVSPDEVVRLEEIVGFDFILDGIAVIDEKKRRLGTVDYYTFDPQSYFVQQLYIKPGFMQSMKVTNLIINRSQIIDIDNKKITVQVAADKASEVYGKIASDANPGGFVNPFRAQNKPSKNAED